MVIIMFLFIVGFVSVIGVSVVRSLIEEHKKGKDPTYDSFSNYYGIKPLTPIKKEAAPPKSDSYDDFSEYE